MSMAEVEENAPTSERAVELPSREERRRKTEEEEDDGAARKRLLLVIPLVTAAAAIVGLVLIGMQDKGIYSKPVDELVAQKGKYQGKAIRAEGLLVHGSIVKRESPCEYRFRIEKNGTEVPVRFAKCIVPDTFRDVAGMDLGVTVEGELRADGSFEANDVLAKCPSKYEMQEKQKNGEKAPHMAITPTDMAPTN